MVTAFNIVYNTVVNFTVELDIVAALLCRWLVRGSRVYRRNREDDGRKISQTRDRPSAETTPAVTDPAQIRALLSRDLGGIRVAWSQDLGLPVEPEVLEVLAPARQVLAGLADGSIKLVVREREQIGQRLDRQAAVVELK